MQKKKKIDEYKIQKRWKLVNRSSDMLKSVNDLGGKKKISIRRQLLFIHCDYDHVDPFEVRAPINHIIDMIEHWREDNEKKRKK